jgi:hypothetical protein
MAKNPQVGVFPVMPWLRKQFDAYSDKEIREFMAEEREDLRFAKRRKKAAAAEKKKGRPRIGYELSAYESWYEAQEDIEQAEHNIAQYKAILEARKEARRKKREAKRPPKAPVMRRRGGVTTRANPKKRRIKNVRDLMREALK